MDVGIIVNPIAGRSRARTARVRAELARHALRQHRLDGTVRLTDEPGHAAAIAAELLGEGATTLVAWGGDGTINEVADVVAGADATLGIVPGGSGNGFARALGIPARPQDALHIALAGATRRIDTGVVDGRRFVNVAGVGFDAHLAHRFNQLTTRGAAAYIRVGIVELLSYRSARYTVCVDDNSFSVDAFLLTVANGPEYGTGATIARGARLDDGRLDLVVVPPRPVLAVCWQARRLFTGTIDRIPDVHHLEATTVEIEADRSLVYHVDGEVYEGSTQLRVEVQPASLRVRAPR